MKLHESKKDNTLRFNIIKYSMFIAFGFIFYKLYELQIVYNEKYKLLSYKNSVKITNIFPKRGDVVAADNKLILCNKSNYRLCFNHKDKDPLNLQNNLKKLMPFVDLSNCDALDILKRIKSNVILKEYLTEKEYLTISLHLHKFPDFYIDNLQYRYTYMPFEFAHIIGTVQKQDKMIVGNSGVEAAFNKDLFGELGSLQTETNSLGQTIRCISRCDAVDGKSIHLTIDEKLQKFVFDLLADKQAGACIVIDLHEKSIKALVSYPSFNINLFSSKIDKREWNSIIKNPLKPLLNRAICGTYAPGSVIKPIIAYAALCEGIISENDKIFCEGKYVQDNHPFHCWNRSGHGYVNVVDALSMSCDCFFYEIAKKLGIDTIYKYAELFGYGHCVGIGLPEESSGLLPNKIWKLCKHGATWKPYDTILIGIGQGLINATVLQNAVMFSKICSGSFDFLPKLVMNDEKNKVIINNNSFLNKNVLATIKKGLYNVCNSYCGTAFNSCNTEYKIFGKTGSSQVRRIKKHEIGVKQSTLQWENRDHAFFIGAAPYENARYVVAVFIEHGGGGASAAAPVARKIFDAILLDDILKSKKNVEK